MILNILLLIIGFVVLIKGADLFVEASSSLAENFKVPKMLIALTIVAFGTSAPEFAVSIKSMLAGSGDIVLGNVIGSNILNILLILGVASSIHTLNVKSNTVRKELPITMLITTLFAILLSDKLISNKPNMLTRSDGIIIILFFLVFIYYLFTVVKNTKSEDMVPKYSLFKSITYTVVGIVCLILGSNTVVDSAIVLAKIFGVSQRLISLTIIAFGTSLPELVTSVVAVLKKEYDIAIGNIVGSNIFNIGIVIGFPVALLGGINRISFSYIDLAIMVISSILLFLFCYKNYKLSKKEGITFLLMFLLYYSYVIFM